MIDTTIVYSYKFQSLKNAHLDLGLTEDQYTTIVEKWYKLSMSVAKKLGYNIALYTDSLDSSFIDLADEVIFKEDYYTQFWDSYKFIALEERDDNFILVDGDVILKEPIPEFNYDVIVDYMSKDRYRFYRLGLESYPSSKNTLKQFYDNKVTNIFPEFDITEQVSIPTTGVLKFNCDKKRFKYLDSWKKLYNLTKDANINFEVATSVAAEYALGCLIDRNNWTFKELSSLSDDNYYSRYYKHYMGKVKFKPGVVNFDLRDASLI